MDLIKELAEMKRSLTNQAPDMKQIERIEALRKTCIDFSEEIITLCPDGEYKHLAKKNLEITLMWAVKSIILDLKE